MSKYIDAENIAYFIDERGQILARKELIDDIKTADVEPVRHGHWIEQTHEWDFEPFYYTDYECSICGIREQDKRNYCPDCGAKMDGKESWR